jgi:hypothetical protein
MRPRRVPSQIFEEYVHMKSNSRTRLAALVSALLGLVMGGLGGISAPFDHTASAQGYGRDTDPFGPDDVTVETLPIPHNNELTCSRRESA